MSHTTATRPASADALLAHLVDYAGLFPPAGLGMRAAVAEYATALTGGDAWMLGRFVVPAGRLPEFAAELAGVATSTRPWRLSALVADASDADLAAIAAFNTAHTPDRALVDAIESKPRQLDGIDWLAERTAGRVEVYVELDVTADPAPWLARIAAHGLRAKIRTGGVTAAAFPPPHAVATFVAAAVAGGVPFKATAGLHHPVRGSYRLTYASDAPSAPMYGYVNVLLATAALRAGEPVATAEALLLRSDASSLTFTDAAVRWGDLEIPGALLHATRAEHLLGFGSCSFREPVDEIRPFIASHHSL